MNETQKMVVSDDARAFADFLMKDPGVEAVAVNFSAFPLERDDAKRKDSALLLALQAADTAMNLAQAGRGEGSTNVMVRWGGYKAIAIAFTDRPLSVSVVHPTGHPVAKSVKRMLRRALRKVYKIGVDGRVPAGAPAPIQDAPTAVVG